MQSSQMATPGHEFSGIEVTLMLTLPCRSLVWSGVTDWTATGQDGRLQGGEYRQNDIRDKGQEGIPDYVIRLIGRQAHTSNGDQMRLTKEQRKR